MLAGVAAPTWIVPTWNGSETTPETLGLYVVGIALSVFADALIKWKRGDNDQVTETILVVSFILGFFVLYNSVKGSTRNDEGMPVRDWRPFAELCLYICLFFYTAMWAMLIAVDPPFRNPAVEGAPAKEDLPGR